MFKTVVEKARMLREWRVLAEKPAVAARKFMPDSQVYAIGSVARGEAIASSDLNILIVSSKAPEKPRELAELKTRIEEELNPPIHHPLEIHTVKPEESKKYLKNPTRI